jgi:hypothetical protein
MYYFSWSQANDWRSSTIDQAFRKPPSQHRPLFRYWIPDASVDGDVLADDIKNAHSIGAGGVELLPFYNYGGYGGNYPPGADWVTYNFGTPAFNRLFVKALQTHRELSMKMDFSLGPNQGQGVPADSRDEGLQWDLVSPFSIPPTKNSS